MSPAEWLERDYDALFHEENRKAYREDMEVNLAYYAYSRPYDERHGSGAYTPLFSIKRDDTPFEQLFSRPVNVVD